MIVADTSAVLAALAGRPADPDLVERLGEDPDLHAPHLIDVEVLSALRRLVASGALSEDRAADVRTDFADLSLTRYPHHPLADRVWALRGNLTAYDAVFVALSEVLECPLVTCDAGLASAARRLTRVELFPASRRRR